MKKKILIGIGAGAFVAICFGIFLLSGAGSTYYYSPPKGPTTSSAGGMGKPPWGKTFAFPPKGGLANRSFFTGRPLKSGSLLMLHPISFVLFLNILLYRLFIYIADRLAIISSCPDMTIPFLSIFWMSVKYHKRTLAFNKAYGL